MGYGEGPLDFTMAFVDELSITAKAGCGGDGVVRWLHLKGKEFSGPAGGNGGDGGDIYIHAVRDIAALARYTGVKHFEAESGKSGEGNGRYGKRGDDTVIDLPVGSVVVNKQTKEVYDLSTEGMRAMILKGGRGGLGNEHFKSSTNRTPMEATLGTEGEEGDFYIELRLVADGGLIGLPNAGKSSLLNALTGTTKAKVGSYAFTTLEPSLGALYEFVLADIPGLIEGASGGKGLGYQFLRHIARTRILFHCVSLEEDDILARYQIVREELRKHSPELMDKEEIVILTKTDARDAKDVQRLTEEAREHIGAPLLTVSILDDAAVKALRDEIVSRLRRG
ncbi:MAG TPA: GTPase ObgE [Candidatus Paceibacterota bacterium]